MKIQPEQAISILQEGGVVALPTETVYGLAADAFSPSAIGKIFELKRRPQDNPLIVHIHKREELSLLCSELPPSLDALIDAFWPGPLTFVLPALESVPLEARGGLNSVAVRMPAHPLMRQVLASTGPLVAPSANLSGKPSPTTAEHVEEDFGGAFPVVDGGPCSRGLESTVIVYFEKSWHIARPGALSGEELGGIVGKAVLPLPKTEKPLAPGSHYRHYSPEAKLSRLTAGSGVVLGFDERLYQEASKVYTLGSLQDPQGVAASLYALLRRLDSEGVAAAEVDLDFPQSGLWNTIRERLLRAIDVN